MVNEFECVRTGNERLWVKTPFAVPLNVWSSFVSDIFPKFQLPPEHTFQGKPNEKYLNRWSDFDEIADGQAGTYYRHAYLPHCDRDNRRVGVDGLIHVPDSRIFYLDEIQADLGENPAARAAQLNGLKHIHIETIAYLLNQLVEALKGDDFRDTRTTKGLRDRFGKDLAQRGLLEGNHSNLSAESWIGAYNIDKIPIGELPLYMKGQNIDFLKSQTCLDFLRDFDEVLGSHRELTPIDLLQIPLLMKEKYSGVVKI